MMGGKGRRARARGVLQPVSWREACGATVARQGCGREPPVRARATRRRVRARRLRVQMPLVQRSQHATTTRRRAWRR